MLPVHDSCSCFGNGISAPGAFSWLCFSPTWEHMCDGSGELHLSGSLVWTVGCTGMALAPGHFQSAASALQLGASKSVSMLFRRRVVSLQFFFSKSHWFSTQSKELFFSVPAPRAGGAYWEFQLHIPLRTITEPIYIPPLLGQLLGCGSWLGCFSSPPSRSSVGLSLSSWL